MRICRMPSKRCFNSFELSGMEAACRKTLQDVNCDSGGTPCPKIPVKNYMSDKIVFKGNSFLAGLLQARRNSGQTAIPLRPDSHSQSPSGSTHRDFITLQDPILSGFPRVSPFAV